MIAFVRFGSPRPHSPKSRLRDRQQWGSSVKNGIWSWMGGLVPAIVVLGVAGLAPTFARAEAESSFELEVIVASLTNEHDKIDRGAKRLHKELKDQFRYEGIRVLETRELKLSVDDIFDMKLPTRRRLPIPPLVIEKNGALVSVEISGLVQSDLRIKQGQLIIIGAEKYLDGKLVIALRAED